MFAIFFPQIDPIIIKIGDFGIRWYSLAYILGVIFGGMLLNRLAKSYKTPPIKSECIEDMALWSVIGIIAGGRLGYVLFYGIDLLLERPIWIFEVWKGGMSFHGGVIGLALSIWLYCKKHNLAFFAISDLICCVAPIGLMLGRIANFINAELYGRETDMPWGVIFPNAGYITRHPSQLYEAALEGLLLLIIMNYAFYNTRLKKRAGLLSGVFLMLYSIFRMFSECFREPEEMFLSFTMGTALSIPMLMAGAYILWKKSRLLIDK